MASKALAIGIIITLISIGSYAYNSGMLKGIIPTQDIIESVPQAITQPQQEPITDIPSFMSNPTAKGSFDTDSKPIEKKSLDVDLIASLIHERINDIREDEGLQALSYDSKLEHIAYLHSADMAERGFYDHVTPEGHDLRYRLERGGMTCWIAAENLVQGGSYYGDTTEAAAARNAVNAWMNSEGHKENILTAQLSREGIGIAFNEAGDMGYITQNFC